MSESTTKLSDILKASAEVTSLASTDRLLAVDADGGTKKITRAGLDSDKFSSTGFLASVNSGWLRIGSFSGQGDVLLYCGATWGAATPTAILISAIAHINGDANINRVVNLLPSTCFKKARLVKKSNNRVCLDIFFAYRPGVMKVSLIAGNMFSLTEIETNPTIEATDTVWESNLGGGVKRFASTTYAFGQKGGQRDGGSDKTDIRFNHPSSFRRINAARFLHRPQCLHGDRVVQMLQPEKWARRNMGHPKTYFAREQYWLTDNLHVQGIYILPRQLGWLGRLEDSDFSSGLLAIGKEVAA